MSLGNIQYGWEDLRFPAQGINPPGNVGDPDIDTATGLLLFDAGGTELIAGVAQMPHAWEEGSIVKPHLHWQKTTSAAGDVLWRFEYEVANVGDTSPMTYATSVDAADPIAATPDTDAAGENLISSFGDIDMDGYEISALIFWEISRIGGDASDTYGADARLVEFDVHYYIDAAGSWHVFSKDP